jgi:hypothetical protein
LPAEQPTILATSGGFKPGAAEAPGKGAYNVTRSLGADKERLEPRYLG